MRVVPGSEAGGSVCGFEEETWSKGVDVAGGGWGWGWGCDDDDDEVLYSDESVKYDEHEDKVDEVSRVVDEGDQFYC